MSDNLQDPVFDNTQTGGMLLWFGAAADAYAAGEREGAAAERERIRPLVAPLTMYCQYPPGEVTCQGCMHTGAWKAAAR